MVLSLGVHVCIAYKFAIKRKQYPQNSFCNNRGQLIKYRVQPRDPKVPYATLLFGISQRLRLLPKFEKKTIQEAKLWWRQFTQYVKMTQKIDLNTMTTDKEILEEYREELEITIKDIFIWALGEEAVTEMTKTVRDNDPNKMNINQLYILFRIHFIPERNKFHSRADFFGITRETNETAEDVWTRILQTEKNCEFDNVTPAELFASKFLSLIGRSTGD